MAPYFQSLRGILRGILAYFLTDEAYAASITHFRNGTAPAGSHVYYLGAGIGLWGTWQLSTAAGILLGARLPPELSLDFFIILTFIALIVPALEDWPTVLAALTAGTAAVLAYNLPLGSGLIAASLVGIAAGLAAERWTQNRSRTSRKEAGRES